VRPLKFIHCADLHLGTPFKGVSELNPDIGDLLYQSTYASFDKIVALSIEENVDCVLIAGDIYDSEDKSLKAQLQFRNSLSQLSESGISTFIAYGNHDPLDGWSATLKWPEGVFVCPGDEVAAFPLMKNDEIIAMIYGISFAKRDIKENLSLKFTKSDVVLPKIGLLHANVGTNTGHEAYSPCSIEDLAGINMDYWALGHVHKYDILRAENPAIVYSGCSQSRNPREIGPKGCCLVTLESGEEPQIKFISTDLVRYVSEYLDISTCVSWDDLIEAINKKCDEITDNSDGRNIILRLSLKGKTTLHSQLRHMESLSEMLGNIREQLVIKEPWIWLDKLSLDTANVYNLDSIRKENYFISDVVSIFDELANPQSKDWQELHKKFQPLFEKWQGHSYLEEVSIETLSSLAGSAREQILDQLLKET